MSRERVSTLKKVGRRYVAESIIRGKKKTKEMDEKKKAFLGFRKEEM